MAITSLLGSSAPQTTFLKLALWLLPLACACLLAFTIYSDYSAQEAKTSPQQRSQDSVKAAASMTTPELIKLNLFGKLGDQNTAKASNRPLPTTRLQLVLKGVFTNTDPKLGSALIAASKGKPSEHFKVDERLPGGAKLHSVSATSVTIDRSGNLEVLQFPKIKSSVSSYSSNRSAARAARRSTVHNGSNSSPASRYSSAARNSNRMR